jgi:hypothetical protein
MCLIFLVFIKRAPFQSKTVILDRQHSPGYYLLNGRLDLVTNPGLETNTSLKTRDLFWVYGQYVCYVC